MTLCCFWELPSVSVWSGVGPFQRALVLYRGGWRQIAYALRPFLVVVGIGTRQWANLRDPRIQGGAQWLALTTRIRKKLGGW